MIDFVEIVLDLESIFEVDIGDISVIYLIVCGPVGGGWDSLDQTSQCWLEIRSRPPLDTRVGVA